MATHVLTLLLSLAPQLGGAIVASPARRVWPRTGTSTIAGRPRLVVPEHDQVRIIKAEPPVYTIDEFLSSDDCAELIEAARSGSLGEPITYEDEVKLRWDRLVLVLPLIGAGTFGLTSAGYEASSALSACVTTAACLVAGASALTSALVQTGSLLCFTGTKWSAVEGGKPSPQHPPLVHHLTSASDLFKGFWH
jgi:hypothetical protein